MTVVRTLACALLLVGCYASHGREGSSVRDAGVLDGRDAGPRRDAGEIGLPDAGPSACQAWSAVEPVQVTSREGDNQVLDAEYTRPGYLVVAATTNPARDRSRFMHHVFLGGPVADETPLFDPPASGSRGSSLAVDGDRIGATQSDERGCIFRTVLSRDGTMLGDVVRYPPSVGRCNGLLAHGRGFTFFDRERGEVGTLRPDGTLNTQLPVEIFEGDVFWWTRFSQADSAYLVGAMQGGVQPTTARVQRVDRAGGPLGPVYTMPSFLPTASRIRGVPTADGALFGWLQPPLDDPGSQATLISLVPTALDGQPSDAPPLFLFDPVYRDAGWSLVRVGEAVFVVSVQAEPGDRFGERTTLLAQRLAPDFTVAETFTLASGRFLRSVTARTSGRDLFVAYTMSTEPGTQVFAAGLRCAR